MNLEEEIRRDADNAIRNSKPMFDMIDQIFYGKSKVDFNTILKPVNSGDTTKRKTAKK